VSAPPRAPARGRAGSQPPVAVLDSRGRFAVAEPLFERGGRVTLEGSARRAGRPGDIVLLGWGKRGARVLRSLGRPEVARDVLEALMLDRGLRRAFPRAVEAEAADAAARPPGEGERPARRDLTSLTTFTIDPSTARDFDDAISARREDDGLTRVWVHIADVSAYVRPGTALERETQRRATSVYVPGAVEPMLPEALSNEACSLVPGQERHAVTVELTMAGADTRAVAFHRSTIRSDARLDYDQVDRIFAGEERAAEPWAASLEAARGVAAALRERREKRGSLAVESAEPAFEFDDEGHVTGVHFEEQTESHRLIEELMILANERVADHLAERQAPTLYRVHERPQPEAVERLIDQLASLDVPTPPVPERMSPQQAGDVAAAASHLVAEHIRRTGRGRFGIGSLVLRSLKQAYYSPRNVGHAGLASPRYCHFTSPIRRYPDLVAHRALLGSLGLDDAAPRSDELFDAGEYASATEREAMKIERGADDVCLAFLLERRLQEDGREAEFEGEIVGVISKGAFVRFGDEGYEGFLPVRRMRGDWYHLNDEETALVGEGGGRAFRIGDPLNVTVGRVDPPRGRADLELAPD
jgi:ribonuclease R